MHRIRARRAEGAPAPEIVDDAGIVSSWLNDAAHVQGGFASGVAFPRSEADVAALVTQASRVLAVGSQSSLTGGATPRGDLVLSTRALSQIGRPSGGEVRADAGVLLSAFQQALAPAGLHYPPVPTFDGASIGGVISTNAAGAATFKYGSTRRWVQAATIVLASGDVVDVRRGEVTASPDGFEVEYPDGRVVRVPLPSYTMPEVAKLSAGYFAKPGMDLLDLFIGSEGTLGVVVGASLRVVPRHERAVVLIACSGDAQAVAVTGRLRTEAAAAWVGRGPLDVAAIEYMDARALQVVADAVLTRAGIGRPPAGTVLLLAQIEVGDDPAAALERLAEVLVEEDVAGDPVLAAPGDERGAARLFELREAVPSSVNAVVAAAKATSPGVEKTAGDLIVPFDRLEASLALYRETFARHGVDYAIWGHVSDGNLHPNVIPKNVDDVQRGREAILEMAQGVMRMGGAPLAEHGVGRSALKQQLLRELYGDAGIDQMRAVKQALDPQWKLAPGVLFPPLM